MIGLFVVPFSLSQLHPFLTSIRRSDRCAACLADNAPIADAVDLTQQTPRARKPRVVSVVTTFTTSRHPERASQG